MAENDLNNNQGLSDAEGGEKPADADETPIVDGDNANDEGGELDPKLAEVKKNLLRDYHAKMQKLAEERRLLEAKGESDSRDAGLMRQISQEPWFKKALEAEKARRNGVTQEITDEDWEAVRSDKRAFNQYLSSAIKSAVDGLTSGELSQHRNEILAMRKERLHERLSSEFGEGFKKAYDSGALQPDLDKGYSLEDAYARYALRNGKSGSNSAEEEAERILADKKAGSVSKSGGSPNPGTKVHRASNLNDAFDILWDSHQSGKKVRLEKVAKP